VALDREGTMWAPSVPLTESKIMSYSKPVDMNSRLPNQITVERGISETEVAIWKKMENHH